MSEETLNRILTVVELLATKFDSLAQDVEALRQESKNTSQAAVDALKYLVELEEKVDVIDKDVKNLNGKVDILEENDRRIEAKVDTLIIKVEVIEEDLKIVKQKARVQQREIDQLQSRSSL